MLANKAQSMAQKTLHSPYTLRLSAEPEARFLLELYARAPGERQRWENRRMAQAQLQTVEPDVARRQTVTGLVTIFLTYFVYSYFFQILLSAMPRITADLDGMHLYSWGVSIPNLGLAFAMLITGKLSDLYGRRALLLASIIICLIGAVWSALSSTFVMLIVARTFLSIGQGGLAPLCFSALGDMFEPVERSKWIGLLNIPAGIFAFVGPTLGGWFVDQLSWRYIFWCGMPLLVVCLLMVLFGLSGRAPTTTPKIDSRGALLAAVASSTMILAFSLAGTMYPWASAQVLGLLGVSVVFWILFIKAEAGAEEPILDLQVLRNRTFITIASACLLSAFGLTGLMIYYPLMMQGIQGVSATLSGQIITPSTVLMNFLGVAVGFILARTKRYKWMFVLGYGLATVVVFPLIFFDTRTPVMWGFVVTTLAGLGMGAIPTLNTLVVQYAVPKRLLGVATGALYFSVMIGQAVAPAVLGSAMNMKYNSQLQESLPQEVTRSADKDTMNSLGNSRVLLSESAMTSLKTTLAQRSSGGVDLLEKTVSAIRYSMESGLRMVFIFSAIAMVLAFATICTIPQISIDAEVEDKRKR
jgi:MFS family permease